MSHATISHRLPPLTARQLAAVEAAGADGRRWAHRIIGNHEHGLRVDRAQLLYARQILAFWDNLKEVA